MAITLADFDKIWASTSPLTPYSFSEANYKRGWNFIGSTPPARQMWDSYMKASDEKHQWLYNNKLSLSGGTMTGGLTASSIAFIPSFSPNIYVNQDYSDLKMYGGTAVHKGGDLQLFGKDSSLLPGYFRLAADDGTNRKQLIGTPGGSLTWDNNDVALAKDVLPLSGGMMTDAIVFGTSDIIRRNVDTGYLRIMGGTVYTTGASITLMGQDRSSQPGEFVFRAKGTSSFKDLNGKPDGSLAWGDRPLFRGYSNINDGNGLGYEKNEANNTVKQWNRIGVNAGASATWTFIAPMANSSYYASAVGENDNNVSITSKSETAITVQNNGSAWCGVNILVIGIPALQ